MEAEMDPAVTGGCAAILSSLIFKVHDPKLEVGVGSAVVDPAAEAFMTWYRSAWAGLGSGVAGTSQGLASAVSLYITRDDEIASATGYEGFIV